MKKILITIIFCLLSVRAFADSSSTVELIGLGLSPELTKYLVTTGVVPKNNTWESWANATPAATAIQAFKLNATNNLEINAISGKTVILEVAKTPVATVDGVNGLTLNNANQAIFFPTYAPVLISTPVAGTNYLASGSINVIPTVAANAAAFLGSALTPIPGGDFYGVNTGANAVRIKAAGAATLNGATAGGYLSVASLASFHCKYITNANVNCELPVAPTPAGP